MIPSVSPNMAAMTAVPTQAVRQPVVAQPVVPQTEAPAVTFGAAGSKVTRAMVLAVSSLAVGLLAACKPSVNIEPPTVPAIEIPCVTPGTENDTVATQQGPVAGTGVSVNCKGEINVDANPFDNK